MKTIDVKDAQILEDFEEQQILNHNTQQAIGGTYNSKFVSKGRGIKGSKDFRESKTQSIPFTSKRRKLPGKRKWKNKDAQYAVLKGQMTSKLFNKKQAAMKVLDKIYKEKAKQRKAHSLVDNA